MYALITGYWHVLINCIIIHTCAIYQIQITTSLFDEDAVYLIEGVVGGLHTYLQEGVIPYCLRGPSTYTQRQKG